MNRSDADIVAEQVAWMREQGWAPPQAMQAIGCKPATHTTWDDVTKAYALAHEGLAWQRGWSAASV